MPTISVTFDITLESEEVKAMAEAVGCSEQQLASALSFYAETALREYADMVIRDAPITTASDLRERRLVGLIKIALGGRMPDAGIARFEAGLGEIQVEPASIEAHTCPRLRGGKSS